MEALKTPFTGFDPKTVGNDVLKFVKSSFDAAYDNAAKIQDMNEKIYKNMLEVSKEMQAESIKMVDAYVDNTKKGMVEYKKLVEEGFKKAEEML